jgi:hypothetical protein
VLDRNNGISSYELQRKLKTIYKTADLLEHPIFDITLGKLLSDIASR